MTPENNSEVPNMLPDSKQYWQCNRSGTSHEVNDQSVNSYARRLITGSVGRSDVVNSKAIKCYWLSVDDEDSTVRVYATADVWVRRLIDGRWFLQHTVEAGDDSRVVIVTSDDGERHSMSTDCCKNA